MKETIGINERIGYLRKNLSKKNDGNRIHAIKVILLNVPKEIKNPKTINLVEL